RLDRSTSDTGMMWTSSFMSTFPTVGSGVAVRASVVVMSTSWLRCLHGTGAAGSASGDPALGGGGATESSALVAVAAARGRRLGHRVSGRAQLCARETDEGERCARGHTCGHGCAPLRFWSARWRNFVRQRCHSCALLATTGWLTLLGAA